MAQRLEFLDVARGCAILLVVLGHAIQYTVSDFNQHLLFRLIYAVHMSVLRTLFYGP